MNKENQNNDDYSPPGLGWGVMLFFCAVSVVLIGALGFFAISSFLFEKSAWEKTAAQRAVLAEEWNEYLHKLETDINGQKEKLDTIETDIAGASGRMTVLREQENALQSNVTALASSLQKWQEDEAKARAAAAALKQFRGELEGELKELRNRHSSLKTDIATSIADRDSLRAEHDAAQKQLNDLKSSIQSNRNELGLQQTSLAALRDQISTEEAILAKTKRQSALAQADNAQRDVIINSLQNQVAILQGQYSALTNQVEMTRRNVQAEQAKLDALNMSISATQSRYDTLNASYQAKQQEHAALELRVIQGIELQAQMNATSNQLALLRKELQDTYAELSRTREDIAKHKQEEARLTSSPSKLAKDRDAQLNETRKTSESPSQTTPQ